jgi:phosphatidate cytidylyltransferase
MLRQRIITAVILLAVFLPTLFHPDTRPFFALTLLLMAAAAWEWGRLNGLGRAVASAFGLLFVLVCAVSWLVGLLDRNLSGLWSLTGLIWVLGGGLLLARGQAAWHDLSQVLRCALGLLLLWAAWLAVAQARALGIDMLLSVLTLVWVADVAAYFVGRAWGGRLIQRKLAPAISPGKTWEGALGGALAVLLLGLVWSAVETRLEWPMAERGLHGQLLDRHGGIVMALALLFLAAMSVVGDLFESLLKRNAGVKDSSRLLPGHGGVLDRVDALLPVLPLAMMLLSYRGPGL